MITTATAPADDLAALVQLEQLEERRDRATLAKLAALYSELGILANLYANVLENAQRLKVAGATYAERLTSSQADDLVDELQAAGVLVFEPYGGDSVPGLREAAAICSRLASTAREAGRSGCYRASGATAIRKKNPQPIANRVDFIVGRVPFGVG